MKYRDILGEVKKEIIKNKQDTAKAILMERLLEIDETEKALGTLKAQLKELLAKSI